MAFVNVYTSKMPVTACDLFYDQVLPFYEVLDVGVEALLTSNAVNSATFRETIPLSCCS